MIRIKPIKQKASEMKKDVQNSLTDWLQVEQCSGVTCQATNNRWYDVTKAGPLWHHIETLMVSAHWAEEMQNCLSKLQAHGVHVAAILVPNRGFYQAVAGRR